MKKKSAWDELEEASPSSWDELEEIPSPSKSSKGWGSVASDIGESVAGLPSAIGSFLSELPGQAASSAKQLVTNPLRATENVGAGVLEGLKGAVNIPNNIAQYIKSKGIGEEGVGRSLRDLAENQLHIGDTGLEKKVLGESQEGDQLLRGLGSFSPYAGIGRLSSGLSGAFKRAGAAGAYGAGQNQDPLQAALLNSVLESGIKGTAKGANQLRPSVMFRGNLSPSELEANLRASQGTETPLGRVLESPKLAKLFENVTAEMPFSGGKDILDSIKNQVEGRATSTIESLRPENINGDLNDLTQGLLKNAYEKERQLKNDLYRERNEIAEKEGHELKLPRVEKTARGITKSIEESPLYKDDPEFRSQYNKLLGYKKTTEEIPAVESKILDEYGNPFELEPARTIRPSLTEAQVMAGDLYRKGDRLSKAMEPKTQILGNNLKKLSTALSEDIENSISSGSPELRSSHKKANKEYKENFSPFKDEAVWKKLFQKEPEKIVQEIIKPGKKSDQYRTIQKVMNLLPSDQKNILGYTYLKGAEDKLGNVNPKELAQLINSLGKRQFKTLFPDEKVRQNILDYGKLRGMNEEALNILYNPKTGARTVGNMLGVAQIMNFANHPIASSTPTAISYGLNKVFTSEKIRDNLVKKMIENSSKKPGKSSKSDILSESLRAALMAQQKSDQTN